MRHLQTVSYVITALGVLLVVAAIAVDLPVATSLAGLLLIVAGVVKIVMVAIWHGVAGMGSSSPNDQPIAHPAPVSSGRRGVPGRKAQ